MSLFKSGNLQNVGQIFLFSYRDRDIVEGGFVKNMLRY